MLDTYTLIDEEILKEIADAIREQLKVTKNYKPSEMATAIKKIL